uniref:Uncharacterized protein n=1 Tax=Rhipicephalus zambeziensis TaxID=60191 RepID=A0A224YEL6_9ACAR
MQISSFCIQSFKCCNALQIVHVSRQCWSVFFCRQPGPCTKEARNNEKHNRTSKLHFFTLSLSTHSLIFLAMENRHVFVELMSFDYFDTCLAQALAQLNRHMIM